MSCNHLTIVMTCLLIVSSMTQVHGKRANKLKNMLNTVKQLQETVVNMSNELNDTKSTLTSKLEETKAALNEDLVSVKTKMDAVDRNLREKDSQIRTMTTDIGELKSSVAFQVGQSSDPLVLDNQEVLKFDTVLLNEGGGYNPDTGIFTAPTTGTYLFWANVMSDDKGYYALLLKKEGSVLIRGYVPIGVTYGFASITHVTTLNKGQQVWFANGERVSKTRVEGLLYSAYGGILLKPDL